MKYATKELLTVAGGLIGAFLVLTHYTGFSRDVSAVSSGSVSIFKTLQGR